MLPIPYESPDERGPTTTVAALGHLAKVLDQAAPEVGVEVAALVECSQRHAHGSGRCLCQLASDCLDHEKDGETEHADIIIERMLFLEAEPDFNQQDHANVGSTVREMLQNDLDVEYRVDGMLKEAMGVCERVQDYETRELLTKLLDDTEMDHAYFLEKQLRLTDMVGEQNYLQSQMGEEPGE